MTDIKTTQPAMSEAAGGLPSAVAFNESVERSMEVFRAVHENLINKGKTHPAAVALASGLTLTELAFQVAMSTGAQPETVEPMLDVLVDDMKSHLRLLIASVQNTSRTLMKEAANG